MSALKQRIIARRTQLSNLISYLHKGLEDGIRNSNFLSFNFSRASKASNLNSLLGIVNQKGLWNQSTAVEERAREILHFEVSEVEIDKGKNSEKSMKKDMYKAICKQINYKVVGKQPQCAGDIIKCLKKEMSLFNNTNLKNIYQNKKKL